jgi:hypothetical protein
MEFRPAEEAVMTSVLSLAVLYAALIAADTIEFDPVFKTTRTNDLVSVSKRDQKLLEYRYIASPKKPYLKELYTPNGVQVLRDAPHDHLHHHAIMFAVAVDGVDFWAEKGPCGVEQHRPSKHSSEQAEIGINIAGMSTGRKASLLQPLTWIGPKDESLANEERELFTTNADLGATLLTWRTKLSPAEGKPSIKLTGNHYFGLGVRFVESMDKDGEFFNAAGEVGENVRGKEFLVKAKWAAYTAKADGKPGAVAVFDHPKNPRHPARMFTMSAPFAYLSATLNLWKEPLELKAGETLDVRYGIAAWDGKVEAKQVEELYGKWVKMAE